MQSLNDQTSIQLVLDRWRRKYKTRIPCPRRWSPVMQIAIGHGSPSIATMGSSARRNRGWLATWSPPAQHWPLCDLAETNWRRHCVSTGRVFGSRGRFVIAFVTSSQRPSSRNPWPSTRSTASLPAFPKTIECLIEEFHSYQVKRSETKIQWAALYKSVTKAFKACWNQ